MLTIINQWLYRSLNGGYRGVAQACAHTAFLIPATVAAAVYVATHIANSDMSEAIGEDAIRDLDQFNEQSPSR
jgi:hypothetical protein